MGCGASKGICCGNVTRDCGQKSKSQENEKTSDVHTGLKTSTTKVETMVNVSEKPFSETSLLRKIPRPPESPKPTMRRSPRVRSTTGITKRLSSSDNLTQNFDGAKKDDGVSSSVKLQRSPSDTPLPNNTNAASKLEASDTITKMDPPSLENGTSNSLLKASSPQKDSQENESIESLKVTKEKTETVTSLAKHVLLLSNSQLSSASVKQDDGTVAFPAAKKVLLSSETGSNAEVNLEVEVKQDDTCTTSTNTVLSFSDQVKEEDNKLQLKVNEASGLHHHDDLKSTDQKPDSSIAAANASDIKKAIVYEIKECNKSRDKKVCSPATEAVAVAKDEVDSLSVDDDYKDVAGSTKIEQHATESNVKNETSEQACSFRENKAPQETKKQVRIKSREQPRSPRLASELIMAMGLHEVKDEGGGYKGTASDKTTPETSTSPLNMAFGKTAKIEITEDESCGSSIDLEPTNSRNKTHYEDCAVSVTIDKSKDGCACSPVEMFVSDEVKHTTHQPTKISVKEVLYQAEKVTMDGILSPVTQKDKDNISVSELTATKTDPSACAVTHIDAKKKEMGEIFTKELRNSSCNLKDTEEKMPDSATTVSPSILWAENSTGSPLNLTPEEAEELARYTTVASVKENGQGSLLDYELPLRDSQLSRSNAACLDAKVGSYHTWNDFLKILPSTKTSTKSTDGNHRKKEPKSARKSAKKSSKSQSNQKRTAHVPQCADSQSVSPTNMSEVSNVLSPKNSPSSTSSLTRTVPHESQGEKDQEHSKDRVASPGSTTLTPSKTGQRTASALYGARSPVNKNISIAAVVCMEQAFDPQRARDMQSISLLPVLSEHPIDGSTQRMPSACENPPGHLPNDRVCSARSSRELRSTSPLPALTYSAEVPTSGDNPILETKSVSRVSCPRGHGSSRQSTRYIPSPPASRRTATSSPRYKTEKRSDSKRSQRGSPVCKSPCNETVSDKWQSNTQSPVRRSGSAVSLPASLYETNTSAADYDGRTSSGHSSRACRASPPSACYTEQYTTKESSGRASRESQNSFDEQYYSEIAFRPYSAIDIRGVFPYRESITDVLERSENRSAAIHSLRASVQDQEATAGSVCFDASPSLSQLLQASEQRAADVNSMKASVANKNFFSTPAANIRPSTANYRTRDPRFRDSIDRSFTEILWRSELRAASIHELKASTVHEGNYLEALYKEPPDSVPTADDHCHAPKTGLTGSLNQFEEAEVSDAFTTDMRAKSSHSDVQSRSSMADVDYLKRHESPVYRSPSAKVDFH